MPELAEVDHSRRQWDPGLKRRVAGVFLARTSSRLFRDVDTAALPRLLAGQTLISSESHGKQMLFRFSGDLWLGIHLGMRGELRSERISWSNFVPRKHDYLVLWMDDEVVLAFEDKRVFGRIRFHAGADLPEWWAQLAPSVLSDHFTARSLAEFLKRRQRTAIKPLLLIQDRFPGVGNWMADEILWRARLHPKTLAGELDENEIAKLYRATRWVCRTAMEIINDDWMYPETWLFPHRWEAGGNCPRCRSDLERATIGGRTTSWCARCQPEKTYGGLSAKRKVRRKEFYN